MNGHIHPPQPSCGEVFNLPLLSLSRRLPGLTSPGHGTISLAPPDGLFRVVLHMGQKGATKNRWPCMYACLHCMH